MPMLFVFTSIMGCIVLYFPSTKAMLGLHSDLDEKTLSSTHTLLKQPFPPCF